MMEQDWRNLAAALAKVWPVTGRHGAVVAGAGVITGVGTGAGVMVMLGRGTGFLIAVSFSTAVITD